jgi:hypothetical protein
VARIDGAAGSSGAFGVAAERAFSPGDGVSFRRQATKRTPQRRTVITTPTRMRSRATRAREGPAKTGVGDGSITASSFSRG